MCYNEDTPSPSRGRKKKGETKMRNINEIINEMNREMVAIIEEAIAEMEEDAEG